MLLDVAGKRFHVVVDDGILQLSRRAFCHDVLVHLHVGHGSVLLFKAAFEAAFAAAEERKLPEAGLAVMQHTTEKMHAQCNVVARDIRILDRSSNFFFEFGR